MQGLIAGESVPFLSFFKKILSFFLYFCFLLSIILYSRWRKECDLLPCPLFIIFIQIGGNCYAPCCGAHQLLF